jgi:uncharacterized membrane protein
MQLPSITGSTVLLNTVSLIGYSRLFIFPPAYYFIFFYRFCLSLLTVSSIGYDYFQGRRTPQNASPQAQGNRIIKKAKEE